MTGAELRGWRRRYGWSAERLAPHLSVAPNTIRRWETGKLPIQHPSMLHWALVGLGLTLERAHAAVRAAGLTLTDEKEAER